MAEILNFSEWVFENNGSDVPNWVPGGMVLILGKVLNDGFRRLYAGRIHDMKRLDKGGIMALLQTENFYVIKREWDKFIPAKMMMNREILKRALGLSNYSIVLNSKSGKTPIWYDSIGRDNFEKFLKEYTPVLDEYANEHPDLKIRYN